MSGVYIKGIKIPGSCSDCLNIGWHYVFECHLDDMEEGKRLASCPLVPVPPHGRLIDADEFFKALTMDDCVSILEAMHVQSILSDAPTIIPADKETPCEDCPYDECSIPEIGSCEVADKES